MNLKKKSLKKLASKVFAILLAGATLCAGVFPFIPKSDKASAEGISEGAFSGPPVSFGSDSSYMHPSFGGAVVSRLTTDFNTITATVPDIVCSNSSFVSYIGDVNNTYFNGSVSSNSYRLNSRAYKYDFSTYEGSSVVLYSIDLYDIICPYSGLQTFLNDCLSVSFDFDSLGTTPVDLRFKYYLYMASANYNEEFDIENSPSVDVYLDSYSMMTISPGGTLDFSSSFPALREDYTPLVLTSGGNDFVYISRFYATLYIPIVHSDTVIYFYANSLFYMPFTVSSFLTGTNTLLYDAFWSPVYFELFSKYYPLYQTYFNAYNEVVEMNQKLSYENSELKASFNPTLPIFSTAQNFFDLEIFPDFKLSYILLLGVGAVIFGFVLKVFLGG